MVFEAIEKITKTKYRYASINSVDQSPFTLKDEMPRYAALRAPFSQALTHKHLHAQLLSCRDVSRSPFHSI